MAVWSMTHLEIKFREIGKHIKRVCINLIYNFPIWWIPQRNSLNSWHKRFIQEMLFSTKTIYFPDLYIFCFPRIFKGFLGALGGDEIPWKKNINIQKQTGLELGFLLLLFIKSFVFCPEKITVLPSKCCVCHVKTYTDSGNIFSVGH